MKKYVLIHLIAPGLFLFGVHYFAYARETIDHENPFASRIIAETARFRVEGLLSCTLAEPNHGEPCTLKIKDKNSGETYELLGNSRTAMKLYQAGNPAVAIEGYPGSENGTIDVQLTQAL